jgi:hypothetical protein
VDWLGFQDVPQRIVKAHIDLERLVGALGHVYRRRSQNPMAIMTTRNWRMKRNQRLLAMRLFYALVERQAWVEVPAAGADLFGSLTFGAMLARAAMPVAALLQSLAFKPR